jgi:hypothetical protein
MTLDVPWKGSGLCLPGAAGRSSWAQAPRRRALALLLVGLCPAWPWAAQGGCTRPIVAAADGYANVRAEPRVGLGNVVAALPAGTSIRIGGTDRGWLKLLAPVTGWVARSQTAERPCDQDLGADARRGLAAIERLEGQARSGDPDARSAYFALSRGVDGSLAEAYSEALVAWAARDSGDLIARLQGQPRPIQVATLGLLDFGLGTGDSPERRAFESALGQPAADREIRGIWRCLSQAPADPATAAACR